MNYLETHLAIVRHLVESTFKHTYKTNSIEDILWDIASNCTKLLKFEDCVIYLLDKERNVFVQKAAYGHKNKGIGIVNNPIEIALGEGIVGYVGKSGIAEIINDCKQDPRYIIDDMPRNSEIAVPLIFDGDVIGIIDSEHSEKNFFTHDHLDIMKSISSICAVKIAEMKAHKENEKLARFFTESTLPRIRLDYNGFVINKNRAADCILKLWNVYSSKISDKEILGIIDYIITNNEEKSIEVELEDRTLNLNFTVIKSRQYINVNSSDITDLKRAKLEAEEANRIKDKFLSVISHEIRTPLNAIVGTLNLLKADKLTPKQANYLKTTDFASEKLMSLLKNILDVEKIEAKKVTVDNTHFKLGDLIQNLKEIFVFEAKSKGNTLEFNIDDMVNNSFYADETKIFQILNNLLNNAIKFTDHGNIILSVFLEERIKNKNKFRFEISDTGIGIPKDKQEIIFKPFEQAEGSISRKYGGTGLGLSIVNNLVDLLGGKLVVNSIEGVGTTFVFTLNLVTGLEKQINKINGEVSFNANELKDIRILLVDDNKINLKIGEQFLNKWGATVLKAEDGFEAFRVFKTQEVDLILMDIHMPKCNGFEATKRIRNSNLSNCTLPIVAITADITSKNKELALSSGIDDIIPKPFNPNKFIDIIQKALSKQV